MYSDETPNDTEAFLMYFLGLHFDSGDLPA